MQHIKVNLPRNKADFASGNGEGCWVQVPDDVKAKHDANATGGAYEGILDNTSWYYPGLASGTTILFTLRGNERPVALIDGCLEMYQPISDEEFQNLLSRMGGGQIPEE